MQIPVGHPPKVLSERTIGPLLCFIEYPKGTLRGGKSWKGVSPADYGYIHGFDGADGDEIDCYIGDCPDNPKVYVVNQTKVFSPDTFDEHKVMLGFESKDDALSTYMKGHDKSSLIFMSIVPLSMQDFLRWLKHGNHQVPLDENVSFSSSASVRKFI